MAGRGNPLVDKDDLRDDVFDPNLRDEGAGFFSTLFTAGSNIGTDALTELGYLAQAVARPKDTAEAILRVAAGYAQKALPDDWEAYLPEDWATNKMYANAINDYYAEKYGSIEQAADSFAEQPVSVALDVFAVKALLTAVTKQAVKRSNATTKMAVTAKGTVLEGELAARAAADLKVAAELEKTVKYEGKLKYDESLGAYVPEAELASRTTLDAAEVAPIASAIDEAVPTMNNSPIPAEGMLNGEVVAANVVSREQMIALAEAKAAAKKKVGELNDAEYNIYTNEGQAAADVFYNSDIVPAQILAIDAEIAHLEAITANAVAQGKSADGSLRIIRNENIKKVALEQDITKLQATDVYNSTLDDVALAEQAALFPLIDEVQKASIIKNGGNSAEVIGIVESNQKTAIAMQEALAARNAVPDVEVPAATTGINLQGIRAGDGSLVAAEAMRNRFPPRNPLEANEIDAGNAFRQSDRIESQFMDGLAQESLSDIAVAQVARGEVPKGSTIPIADAAAQAKALDVTKRNADFDAKETAVKVAAVQQRTADKAKLDRDKQRMADDEIMAGASQAELFSTGTAAQYELAQASRIANDLAKVSPDVPAVVGTRMMAPTEGTKLAKYADVERRTTPPSIPQTKLNLDVKKVVPAVQRVAAASGQQPDMPVRGADNSFLPAQPTDIHPDLSEPFVPIVPERIDVEQPENTRPGWKLPHQFEGSTTEGNYWSADFEDEHWNTPAGISEAMGIWGRPIGNRKIVNPR